MKRQGIDTFAKKYGMPPTRGHDLKLATFGAVSNTNGCPPHGGTT